MIWFSEFCLPYLDHACSRRYIRGDHFNCILVFFFTLGSLLSLPISTYIQKSINFRTITLTFHIPSGLDYRLSQQSKCSGDLDCSGAPQNTPKLPTEAGHRTGSLENSVFSTNRVPLSPSAYNKVSKFY